ncbi:hypothetical protein D1007_34369 [Hordeum vulgare]|nr:hypothetical protein D1007_34369 [Hordeum vulgare]
MAVVHGSGGGGTTATTRAIPRGMDSARAFNLNYRMETSVLGSSGIGTREILLGVPVQCDDELAIMFGTYAESKSAEIEINVKVNRHPHTCPSVTRRQRLRLAKCRWVADAVTNRVRENSNISVTQLQTDLKKKYGVELPYMRVFYAEVEKASPGSVVHIDKHTVEFEKNDATALNGRYRGQLVSACAVDANNWIFPVAYGVLEVESIESWAWFFQHLKDLIGHPEGLVIHTDACKGLESAVDDVFQGVEHMECMRHLAANFSKKFMGNFFDDNLWPCSLTYSSKKHNYHLRKLYSRPDVKEYLDEHHSKIWARALFNEFCKLDYVNNNLAESFNSKIRKWKGLHIVDPFDKIRQYLMEKFDLRRSIAAATYVGHIIVPKVMKMLLLKSKNLDMNIVKRSTFQAEGKQQWDIVDPGFKLSTPVQHRPPGRPRKTRIRAQSEGKGLGGRRKKCSRCGRLGHRVTHFKKSIDPAFGEDEHGGADNAGTEARESAQATAQTEAPNSPPTAPSSPAVASSPPPATSSPAAASSPPPATSSPAAPGSPPPATSSPAATSSKAIDTDLASSRKNFKRPATRGTKRGSPEKKAKGGMQPTVSIRSKAANPAANTRSKMGKLN